MTRTRLLHADRCEAGADACGPEQGHGTHDHAEHDHAGHDQPSHAGHDHGPHAGHAHGLGSARSADRRRLGWSLAASVLVLGAEVAGGLVSRSVALLSDALHVLTDASAQVLALVALIIAARPVTARRTFGYHRVEVVAALVNGLILIGLAGVIVYAAWRRLGQPAEIRSGVMLVTAGVGLIANIGAAIALSHGESLNVRAAYLHVLSDTLSSVGVVIGGLVLWWRPDLTLVDPILAIGIAILIVFSALRLLREALDVLLEAVPAGLDLERLRADVRGLAGVEDVHDLHIWTITSGFHALSAHLVVAPARAAAENDALLHAAKRLLRDRYRIAHSTLQIESTAYGAATSGR